MNELLPHGVYKMPTGKTGKHTKIDPLLGRVRYTQFHYVAKVHHQKQFYYLGRHETVASARFAVDLFYNERGLKTPQRRALRRFGKPESQAKPSPANIHALASEAARLSADASQELSAAS